MKRFDERSVPFGHCPVLDGVVNKLSHVFELSVLEQCFLTIISFLPFLEQ